MQGASALQRALDDRRDAPIRVLAVWERVIWTDWSAPTSGLLARLRDPRAAQYWDRGRALSEKMRGDLAGAHDVPDIIWDAVAIYPKGARWDAALPPNTFFDGPVVRVMDGFRKALDETLLR